MSLNHQLSQMFKTMAAILEIKGEPVFKAIAFSKVGRLLDDATIDIRKLVENDALESLEGVGKSSRKVIEEFVKTGRSKDFDELASSIPSSLIEMLQLPGLGPKTIALLWKERGITTVDELGHAIEAGKLDGLRGVGEKKIAQLKQSISMRDQAGKRFGIFDAMRIGEMILEQVKKIKGVHDARIAGSLRRMKETIGDLDILVTLKPKASGDDVTAAFVKLPQVVTILGQGSTKASVMTSIGLQVDLRVVPKENFGAALLYFTGSKEHNVRLRARAQSMGLTLNEWGLFNEREWESAKSRAKSASTETFLPKVKAVASKSEESVYKALGLDYIEPELREDRGEIDLALANKLPKLVELADIQGELHCHTTASDGENSIEEMAARAKEIGYHYIVITDHSKAQVVARGLEPERLIQQIERVRNISSSIPKFTILIGSEVDILADGSLDYPDDLLKELDFVIASPHVALRQDITKATERILRAIDNKYVNVIGHPTGRLIHQRSGLEYDWPRVFSAARGGTALEINAAYPRLDLTDQVSRAAIASGVMLSIDTDAHNVDGLASMTLGISVARRAGATKSNILNCQPLEFLRQWVRKKRDR